MTEQAQGVATERKQLSPSETLAFFKSVIHCGEAWSSTCQAAFDNARAELAAPDSKLEAYRKALASGVNELNAIAVFAEDNGKSAADKSDRQAWAAHARAIREAAKALAAGG